MSAAGTQRIQRYCEFRQQRWDQKSACGKRLRRGVPLFWRLPVYRRLLYQFVRSKMCRA